MPKWKLNHFKYRNEFSRKDDDINIKMKKYIEKHRIHSYLNNNTPMVEVHVDDLYAYDEDKNLQILAPLGGGGISVCLPEGTKPIITFDQDEAIFRSSQLNDSCW